MNAKQFLDLVYKSNRLSEEDHEQLLTLTDTYPFFQIPKILAAKYEWQNQDGFVGDWLHWAAIQSPDRKHLKKLVENNIDFIEKHTQEEADNITTAPVTSVPVEKTTPEKETGDKPENPENKSREIISKRDKAPDPKEENASAQKEAVRNRKEILKKLEDNLDKIKQSSAKSQKNEANADVKNTPKPKRKSRNSKGDDLIESIKRKEKKEIVDSTKREQIKIIKAFSKKSIKLATLKEIEDGHVAKDLSEESTFLNDNLLSESYAKLLTQQGKKDKAKEIYQKLTLKFPAKKAYFADQIKKLEE